MDQLDGLGSEPGIRFQPPAGDLPAEVRATLELAYAEHPQPADLDPQRLWQLASALGAAQRIANRLGELPKGTLPPELADRCAERRARAVAARLLYEEMAGEVAGVAASLRAPLVLLKGYALHALGLVGAGARELADLDVLASATDAERLQSALVESGYTELTGGGNEQHLAPLAGPRGGVLDVHFRLRGVRVATKPWATVEELVASGAVGELAAHSGALVPRPEILAAHLLVHGIEQHGFRPATYPLLRMIEDAAALLPDPAAWRRFLDHDYRTIEESVTPAEVRAVAETALALSAGRLPDRAREPRGWILLRHIAAGALDPAYARTLRRRHLAGRVRTAWRRGHLAAYLRRKLFGFRLR